MNRCASRRSNRRPLLFEIVHLRYLCSMRVPTLALLIVAVLGPAMAQDFDRTRELNALHDIARAQERQADELRRLRQIEQDRDRRADRERRAAETMSRSARRFDHP